MIWLKKAAKTSRLSRGAASVARTGRGAGDAAMGHPPCPGNARPLALPFRVFGFLKSQTAPANQRTPVAPNPTTGRGAVAR